MRLPHRLQGQKVKSQGGAGAYCGGDLAAQLVTETWFTDIGAYVALYSIAGRASECNRTHNFETKMPTFSGT